MLLFKYLSPDAVPRVFERANEVAIKFGLPATFNDPYELFLQPDIPLKSAEHLAFYEYFLGDIPQLPVTCFSKNPDSIVMWAHYGRERSGVCLGFDEDTLTSQFPVAYIDNVSYSHEPAQIESSLIDYAFATGKRRHTLALLAIANRAAYFVKRMDWQYECERRLVVGPDDVEPCADGTIAKLPSRVLRYIILGQNCNEAVRTLCKKRSAETGVPLLEFRIGKRSYEPFFLELGKALGWKDTAFERLPSICSECGDPAAVVSGGNCSWCGISEEIRKSAPKRSMLAATLHFGIDELNVEFKGLEPKGSLTKKAPSTPDSEPPVLPDVERL